MGGIKKTQVYLLRKIEKFLFKRNKFTCYEIYATLSNVSENVINYRRKCYGTNDDSGLPDLW